MATQNPTKQAAADAQKALGNYIGLATANPSTSATSATPANEVSGTGGSGAYARVATTWTSGTNGTVTGSAVTIQCPATTVTYAFQAAGLTSATLIDAFAITSTTLPTPGQLVVTPSLVWV